MTQTAFTLPFHERYEELQALAAFYDHGWHHGAGFLLLYGRKGIGKTRLLQQFLQEQAIADVFYWQTPVWQAPPGDAAAQLQDFSQALLRYDPARDEPPSPDFSFFDWQTALDHLAQIAECSSDTKLFILEGFTELCHSEMGLSSYFQHAWDHRLKEIFNLRLIITGSHISTMIREVLAYSAPLYFRANASLHLKPLRYTGLLDLFPDHTPEERLAIYAITGGIPAYLTYFVQTPDVLTAIENLCFAPGTPFLSDMEMLFDERLEDPALCRAILTAVADGYGDPDGLSGRLGVPYDDLQPHLFFLRLFKLLDDQRSVHGPDIGRGVRHVLAEPSLYFYYQHLAPALEKQNSKETATAAYASVQGAFGEKPFIALCREWIWAAVVTKQLGMLPQRVGAYWNDLASSPEFSIAAADPWQKKLLVGAGFWENGRLTPAVLKKIIHDSQQLPQVREEGWTVEQVIFGRWPFTEEIQAVADVTGVRLVTLAEIEPLLPAARTQLRWERDNPSPVEIEF